MKRLAAIALAAVMMSAAVASTAQAGEWTATNKKYPLTVTGGQTVAFSIVAGPRTITCSTISFEATIKAVSFNLPTTPKFEKCKANGGLGATVLVNGCKFGLTGGALAHGELRIECPFLTSLEIPIYASEFADGEGKAAVCTLKYASQGPEQNITWTNEGFGNATEVKGEVAVKLKYTVAGNEGVCGAAGTGEIKGTTTMTGEVGMGAEGVDIG